MEFLIEPIKFDWDNYNIEHIRTKHKIEPYECEQIFFNLPFVVGPDTTHSQQEVRYYLYGKTDTGKILFAVFTIRRNKIRIVTARTASRKERRLYYEQTKKIEKNS